MTSTRRASMSAVHVRPHFRHAPLPQVHRIRRSHDRATVSGNAGAPRFGTTYGIDTNLVTVGQLARQPFRVVARSVRRDDRDSVAPGQLRDDLQAADPPAGRSTARARPS